MEVEEDEARESPPVLKRRLLEVCCRLGKFEPVNVHDRECEVRARESDVAGDAEALRHSERPTGERRGLGAVAAPGAHERERTLHVDTPHGVLDSGPVKPEPEALGARHEIAKEEVGPPLRVQGHDLGRISAAETEEVDDLSGVHLRDRFAHRAGGLQGLMGGELAENEEGVQRLRGDCFTGGQVGSPYQVAVGLRRRARTRSAAIWAASRLSV